MSLFTFTPVQEKMDYILPSPEFMLVKKFNFFRED